MKSKKHNSEYALLGYVLMDIDRKLVFSKFSKVKLTKEEAIAKNYGYALNGSSLRYQKV